VECGEHAGRGQDSHVIQSLSLLAQFLQ